MKIHPVAALFPMLSQVELNELASDIRLNGLQLPVVVQGGVLLDGRNRLAACKLVGVKPEYREYTGKDAQAYIIGANLHRRHLTESQRGTVAARLANMSVGGIRAGQNTIASQTANLQSEAISRAEAAELLNVSERTVNALTIGAY